MPTVDEMVVKWSMDSAKFDSGVNAMNKQMNLLKSEFKATSINLKNFGTTTDQLKNKQQYLSNAMSIQKEKVSALRQQYEKQKQATGENSTATQNLAIKLNNAIKYYNDLEGELKDTTKELENQSSKLTQLSQKFDSASKKFSSFGKTMSTAITAPILGIAGASAKTAISFEAAMSNVEAISGATGDELKSLEDKAKEMGEQTSKSAKESADALGYMALAGWDTQQMLEGLEPVLRASEAGNIDLATCSDLVTNSMSSLSLQVGDLGKYLDIATKTQNSASTNLQQMLEAYNEVGGTFSNLNVSLEEGATWLGVLANRSLKGSEAGNLTYGQLLYKYFLNEILSKKTF